MVAPSERWYSTRMAAQLLDVTPETVRAHCKAGKIRHHRLPGGHIRIPFDELSRIMRPVFTPADFTPPATEEERYRNAIRIAESINAGNIARRSPK